MIKITVGYDQSVSPSLRVPRSKSAPSLINTSIIAFIDFLKFIHHYIISDFDPFGRKGVTMRIIEIRFGFGVWIWGWISYLGHLAAKWHTIVRPYLSNELISTPTDILFS